MTAFTSAAAGFGVGAVASIGAAAFAAAADGKGGKGAEPPKDHFAIAEPGETVARQGTHRLQQPRRHDGPRLHRVRQRGGAPLPRLDGSERRTVPSAAHGNCYVNNYANAHATVAG